MIVHTIINLDNKKCFIYLKPINIHIHNFINDSLQCKNIQFLDLHHPQTIYHIICASQHVFICSVITLTYFLKIQ